MKVNDIIAEGPFDRWLGGHLQSIGKRIGGDQDADIASQAQELTVDQRVKAWQQAKQQYVSAGWPMTNPTVYKRALDQWLANQYNSPPVAVAVNDNNVKNYIARSLASKTVGSQTSQLPKGFAFPQQKGTAASVSVTDTQGHVYTYSFPPPGGSRGQWKYNNTVVTNPDDIQKLNQIYNDPKLQASVPKP